MQNKKENLVSLIQTQHRCHKRKQLIKKAKKYCLTPNEYNELIRPLVKEHKRMIAHLEADKQFEESYGKSKTAMEVIVDE